MGRFNGISDSALDRQLSAIDFLERNRMNCRAYSFHIGSQVTKFDRSACPELLAYVQIEKWNNIEFDIGEDWGIMNRISKQ